MISVVELRRYFFRLMSMSQTSGMHLRFSYKNKVYTLDIEPTGEEWHPHKGKVRGKGKKTAVSLRLESCPTCGGILASGICMKKGCPGKAGDPPL